MAALCNRAGHYVFALADRGNEINRSSGRQPNFAALNSGRHLYSTGRPLRWALAHISSFCVPVA